MSGKWNMERALSEPPPILHPLAGCDRATFKAHLADNSEFDTRSQKQRRMTHFLVGLRQPFVLSERVLRYKDVREHILPRDPIFIVGHWRSGTTHLHNLLSHDPNFTSIDFGQTAMPNSMMLPSRKLGRAIVARNLPKERGMDNVSLGIDEPQEEEMAIGNLNPVCYYNCYYFPQNMKRHFDRSVLLEGLSPNEMTNFEQAYRDLAAKLSLISGGKQILFKNPASTSRVKKLKEWFPDARFVHISRNPMEVFGSMLNHYPRLLSAFAWQDFSDLNLEEMVLYKYRRLYEAWLEQKESIPEDHLIETSYEAITERPMEELGRIHRALDLPDSARALDAISEHVKATRGYQRNQRTLEDRQIRRIHEEWEFAFKAFDYPM